MLAMKFRLARAVGLLATAALIAGATAVARVNGDDRHACQSCFVLHERTQLVKSPIPESAEELAANRFLDACADALEIFNGDSSAECLCLLDDLLTDVVVNPSLEPSLPSRHLIKTTFGVLCSSSLVLLASRGPSLSIAFYGRAGERLARTVRGNVDDTEIDTNEILNFAERRFRQLYGGKQEELAVSVNEIALALDAVKSLSLIFAVDETNNFSSAQRGQAHPVKSFESHVTLIICDRAIGLEGGTDSLVSCKAFNSLADGPHGELCRQTESFTDSEIGQMMHARLTKHACVEAKPCGKCRSLVDTTHRGKQKLGL